MAANGMRHASYLGGLLAGIASYDLQVHGAVEGSYNGSRSGYEA